MSHNLLYDIPEWRTVEIKDSAGSIIGKKKLIMNDDFSMKASSKFGQLWEASPNNLMNLLSNSFNIPSGQFALQGAQIWQSADPLTMSVTVNLEMDKDSYTDVVLPVKILTQTCLPSISNASSPGLTGSVEALAQNTLGIRLKTLIPPGPNIQTLVTLMSANPNDKTGLLSKRNGARGLYTVRIGFITFYNTLVTSVEPSFSKEVSKSPTKNKYYPCSASLSLEFSSMEVATTDMICEIFN